MRGVQSLFTVAAALRSGLFVCAAFALLLTAPVGAAAPKRTVTVSITAEIESVDDPAGLLCAALAPGDIITGTYTYALDAPDSNDLDFVGDYAYSEPPSGITLNLGGSVTGTDPSNTEFLVEIVNDYPQDGSDNYLLRSYVNVPFSCGTPVDHIAWQLDDPTGTALSTTELPRKPPTLGDFESFFGLTVEGSSGEFGDRYFIRAHVTSAKRTK